MTNANKITTVTVSIKRIFSESLLCFLPKVDGSLVRGRVTPCGQHCISSHPGALPRLKLTPRKTSSIRPKRCDFHSVALRNALMENKRRAETASPRSSIFSTHVCLLSEPLPPPQTSWINRNRWLHRT